MSANPDIKKVSSGRPDDPLNPDSAPARSVPWFVHVGILLAIVGSNYILRRYLDQAGTHVNSFMGTAYRNELPEIYALAWWEYLLPIHALLGAWQPASILLVHVLEHFLGSAPRVFYFTNAVLVVTCYALSWQVFRSLIFTLTFTLSFAWSTFNHHTYVVSGSVALPLIVSYLLFFLFCQYKLMQPSCNYKIWAPVGMLSMTVYALAYETWLDCVTCMWLAYPVFMVLAYRTQDYRRVKVAAAIVGVTTLTAIAYVLVKTHLSHGQAPGAESDVVMNYGLHRGLVAVEDVIVNWFTLVFIAITTYSPPFLFNGSLSSWRYGTAELIAMQHGYHEQKAHLVGYSHLFLWRFYAGFAAAALLLAFYKSVRVVWRAPSATVVAIFVFLLMTLLPGTTHMLVKYRPMHSAPLLSYHSYFGIVGFSLLLSSCAMWVHQNIQRRGLAWAIVGLIWIDLGYCALARPSFLSHMAVECGFPPYPDAWQNLKEMVRR